MKSKGMLASFRQFYTNESTEENRQNRLLFLGRSSRNDVDEDSRSSRIMGEPTGIQPVIDGHDVRYDGCHHASNESPITHCMHRIRIFLSTVANTFQQDLPFPEMQLQEEFFECAAVLDRIGSKEMAQLSRSTDSTDSVE